MFEKYKKEFQKDLRRKNPFWLHPVSETTRPKKKKKKKKKQKKKKKKKKYSWIIPNRIVSLEFHGKVHIRA
jgi:Ni,Fe-hydrogenase I large subunit